MEDNGKSIMELSGFKPTDVVLAKVKGYPQWPAMVLDESILPDYVLQKKPKTLKIPPKKKNLPFIYVIPVRFFSDDTYIWIKSNEIQFLTTEMINNFLEKPKRRKDNLLESAYQLAKNPLDMELFVKYGSSGKPAPKYESESESELLSESTNESDMSMTDESDDYSDAPPKKKAKTTKAKPSKAKSKAKPVKEKATKAKPGPKPKKKPLPQEIDDDSDWGVDEDFEENFKQGNYIFENIEQEKRFLKEQLTSNELTKQLNQSSKQFNKASDKLIGQLLEVIDYVSEKERAIKEERELKLKELREKFQREKEEREAQLQAELESKENVEGENVIHAANSEPEVKVENTEVALEEEIPRIEIGNTQVKSIVDDLEDLTSIKVPKAVIHKSKIFKMLILANRKVCNSKLNKRINQILEQWASISIELNPLETPNHTTDNTPIITTEATPVPESVTN